MDGELPRDRDAIPHFFFGSVRMKGLNRRIAAILGLFLLLPSVLPLVACATNSEVPAPETEPVITEDEAIAIASQQLPADIVAKAEIEAVLAPDVGPNGTWHVFFENIHVTREDLGWQTGPHVTLGTMDVYTLVLINIDSKTGDILRKKASIKILLENG